MNDITPPAVIQVQDFPAKAAALGGIRRIKDIKEKIKTLNEMQASVYENDPDYSNALTTRIEASEVLKRNKQRVMEENPELISRAEQIKELRQELKEVKSETGYQLGLFQQQTGSSVLIDPDGNEYHIINNYKEANART